MNTYEIEILDTSSGNRNAMPVSGCGWGDASIEFWKHRACDCQMAGYYLNEVRTVAGKTVPLPHQMVAGKYLESNACNHIPSRRFKAVRALLSDGTQVAL